MEIPSPITIYWDLPAASGDAPFILRICGDIMACRPLMLQISDPASALSPGTMAVLEKLKGKGIAVILTLPVAFFREGGRGHLHGLGLKEILLDAERLDHVREIASLVGTGAWGSGVAVISLGYQAAPFFKKYPGRFISIHLADWSAAEKKSVPVGAGVVDWKELFTAAKIGGVQNYFVEMNMDALKASYPFLHNLKV